MGVLYMIFGGLGSGVRGVGRGAKSPPDMVGAGTAVTRRL